jgi:hypothetical protein
MRLFNDFYDGFVLDMDRSMLGPGALCGGLNACWT